MKIINTAPISGMQELLPAAQATFNNLKNTISENYHAHGYLNIETPIIDRTEILLAKAGGDTEKQIYRVVKTKEAADSADQALRFDHTVPLARYVVEHANDLVFPFQVSQIGRNFRGERAQKGRFRELYQCDVDVIGREKLALYYDADVIITLLSTFVKFNLRTPVKARISNRKILTGFLRALGLEEQAAEIFSIIDHAEKVPPEKTLNAFKETGADVATIEKLMRLINLAGKRETVIRELKSLEVNDATFEEGLAELDEVLGYLEAAGLTDYAEADLKIVRGLDYYTGTVFEFILPEYREFGSVAGGGRYENLASYFTEQKLPGVGGSIGLTRLFYVLNEKNLIDATSTRPLDLAIIPLSSAEVAFSLSLAEKLRGEGKSVTLVMTGKKLGDKFKYAAKIAAAAIVIGENEVKTGEYQLKPLND